MADIKVRKLVRGGTQTVADYQEKLNAQGANLKVDGAWGKNTQKAYEQEQKSSSKPANKPSVPTGDVVSSKVKEVVAAPRSAKMSQASMAGAVVGAGVKDAVSSPISAKFIQKQTPGEVLGSSVKSAIDSPISVPKAAISVKKASTKSKAPEPEVVEGLSGGDIQQGKTQDRADYTPEKFGKDAEDIRSATESNLRKKYGRSDIQVQLRDGDHFNIPKTQVRTMADQIRYQKMGASKTSLSLHNLGRASDYQILVGGKPVDDTEMYKVLGGEAKKRNLFWGWDWDKGHVGETDNINTLLKEHPDLKDNQLVKKYYKPGKSKPDHLLTPTYLENGEPTKASSTPRYEEGTKGIRVKKTIARDDSKENVMQNLVQDNVNRRSSTDAGIPRPEQQLMNESLVVPHPFEKGQTMGWGDFKTFTKLNASKLRGQGVTDLPAYQQKAYDTAFSALKTFPKQAVDNYRAARGQEADIVNIKGVAPEPTGRVIAGGQAIYKKGTKGIVVKKKG